MTESTTTTDINEDIMEIMETAEMMYKLQTFLTGIELLFEGKWWTNLLTRVGLIDFHGLVMRAHNELVRARGYGLAWDYRRFYSAEKVHRMFEDPMHSCYKCRTAQRLRPTLKNLALKRLKVGKYRDAIMLAVD